MSQKLGQQENVMAIFQVTDGTEGVHHTLTLAWDLFQANDLCLPQVS